ncbi:MAG TPA: hypothetical protein VN668_22385 [Stellaceae bacterium]|nr:hypothetical protein [Stellaceae bacterium]
MSISAGRAVRAAALVIGVVGAFFVAAAPASATPGFARQTGLACEACHTVFPELTPFGRLFKFNGYVFSNVGQLQDINVKKESTLALPQVAPIAVQLQASNTTLGHSIPDTGTPAVTDLSQKNQAQFPQALSIFYTGKISDNLGAFLQLTWTPDGNSVGIDNSELRFANHGSLPSLGASDFIYGVTLNNNPTSQDVWNSTPAWGYPFITSNVAVGPIASALLDGNLAQTAVGLGGYLWAYNHVYLEFSGYRSGNTSFSNSTTGGPGPLDSTFGPRISGVAPYWRAAWEQDWARNSLTFGTFGIKADTHPKGTGEHGPTDSQTDVALDAQYQYIGDPNIFSAYLTWIHEDRDFNATAAANPHNTLSTLRLSGSYFYNRTLGGSLQFFSTTGSTDATLYAPAAVVGSASGSPDTRGLIAELDYLPWLNTKLGLQYTAYFKFNGASTNYDGSGRNASDNNTLFAFIWTAF